MTEGAPNKAKLQFHYIKSNDYREVPCHGVLGGLQPQGGIWFCMFSERGAIPRTIEYEVDVTDSGQAVGFDEREATASFVDTRSGIVRSVEVGAFLSVDVAERLHQWLGEKIAEAKALG